MLDILLIIDLKQITPINRDFMKLNSLYAWCEVYDNTGIFYFYCCTCPIGNVMENPSNKSLS